MAPPETTPMNGPQDVYSNIRAYFGRYKAEWLREEIFSLFRQPGYFPELEEPRPTVLVGGRGTGKTTALKCLSYEGLWELQDRSTAAVTDAPYVGLYWCVDSNRVTAFNGPELQPLEWQRLFGHYTNLEIVDRLSRYARWFQDLTGIQLRIDEHLLNKVATSLHIETPDSITDFSKLLDNAIVQLEAAVNAVVDGHLPPLSMASAPIQYMSEALASDPHLRSKNFFILVDEFENLSEAQQVVINTLIKHGRDRYTFKIGVKEGGWRTHATSAPSEEPLVHPADYDLIDLGERLTDGSYANFAKEVCGARFSRALESAGKEKQQVRIQDAFESLTADEEAQLLGIKKRVRRIRQDFHGDADTDRPTKLLSDLELYYVDRRARAHNRSIHRELEAYHENPELFMRNYRDNYRQSLLFTISEHAGRGIQKYYAGWDTLVRISGGNIRYMMEILERSFSKHASAARPISEPVSARHQTEACIDVGRKYAQEVQSLDTQKGARLTFLLLGLGRFFNLLARHSEGRQPDTTSFVVSPSPNSETNRTVEDLLAAAVMHQVLRRWPATKATSDMDAKVAEYSLHPIFSAFFVIPYQKKRRLRLEADHLALMTQDLRKGLALLLEARRGLEALGDDLPEQLNLFEPAYG